MFALNPLQLLSGETLTYTTANAEDGARLDISASGFWGVNTRWLILMLRCLILKPLIIGDHRFLLFTTSLRRINGRSMSRGFETLNWLHLHL